MSIRENILNCLLNVGCVVNSTTSNLDDIVDNSIMFITFIIQLEECFNIEIPDEYLLMEKFETIDAIVNLVEKLSADNDYDIQENTNKTFDFYQ